MISTTQKLKPYLILLFLLLIYMETSAQLSTKDVQTAVENEWTIWKNVLKIILYAFITITGIGVAMSYLNNRQDSKDHLIKWVIGMVIAGIILVKM